MREIQGKWILVPVIRTHSYRYSQATCLMMRDNSIYLPDCYNLIFLAQSVEPLTAEREVVGLIPGARPIVTQGLKITEK